MTFTLFRFATIIVLFLFSFTMVPQQKQKTEANADLIEFTNKEGLPSTNISQIVQTNDGYIWISGMEGTYRFNGYEFEEVGREFDLHKMQNIYYDSEKNILYAASPNKFITFNGKTFNVYSEKEGYRINGLAGQVITFIQADSKGRIWIGSATPFVDKKFNGGLVKFENGKFIVYDSTNFPLDNADNFIETPYGDLIFSSVGRNTSTIEGAYIALYKNNTFKKIDESVGIKLQNAQIFSQNFSSPIDKDGNTWIAFSGISSSFVANQNTAGVLMYDGTNFQQYTDFGNKFSPLQVFYSKQNNKILLTTALVTSSGNEMLEFRDESIFEFTEGKWKLSNIITNIKNIVDLKTGKIINDFRYAGSIFQNKNKYFPELLMFGTSAQSRSSKYPNQLFTKKNGKWEKLDAFTYF